MRKILPVLFVLQSMWAYLAQAENLYQEPRRPQFHYSPPQMWMNDPNGMLFYQGEYHLFYQYHPYGNTWGPMHWGHAVSRDMVSWETLPIALFPDRHGTIFSGSAVVDWNNSSGFGTRKNPPLVAVFTYNDHLASALGRKDYQTQGIAYSLDKGRTWTKYEGNPVLDNPDTPDFRDPKVSWYEPQSKWIMTLAVKDHIRFYSSRNLKDWKSESDFGQQWGAHGGVWECPDLIEMQIEGENESKYVLLVSINPGAPNGGSGTQYFIGDFDGHQFKLDASLHGKLNRSPTEAATDKTLWLDYGADNYAGVTWSDIPEADGRDLFIGWMSNWDYAQDVPTERWRSAMTLPRALSLARTDGGFRVYSAPVEELSSLRVGKAAIGSKKIARELNLTQFSKLNNGLLEIDLQLKSRDARIIELEFGNGNKEVTVFRINRDKARYELDRRSSGITDFSENFPKVQFAPMSGDPQELSLRAYLDHSSLEIFIDGGATVLTSLHFPKQPYDTVTLKTDSEVELKSGFVYDLESIWEGDRRKNGLQLDQ